MPCSRYPMRRFRLPALLAGLLLVASGGSARPDEQDEAIKKDLKMLEGNWKMVRQDLEGREDSGDSIKKNGVLFDGTEYKFLRDGLATGATATITLDPTKDPKEIDFKVTGGTGSGGTKLGIYRF